MVVSKDEKVGMSSSPLPPPPPALLPPQYSPAAAILHCGRRCLAVVLAAGRCTGPKYNSA
jgi:hypothetical protein